jgi:ElaB/YqjD/DUF883 family membrane-anchored ribosome-binding protein
MTEHAKRKFENFEEEEKVHLKSVGSDLASDFERLGQATKNIASDSLEAVRDELGGLYKQGQKKVTEVTAQLEGRIQSHPVQTILIAAGIGFIIGWFNRKKNKQ